MADEVADFIAGMRAGDFSAWEPAFKGSPSQVEAWDASGAFRDLPDVRAEALTCACFLGCEGPARYFLDQGVAVSGGTATGMNALHWAVNRGQPATVRLLLERGAPLEARSMYDGTALGTAVWSAVNESRAGHPAIIEELLRAGARVSDAGYPSGDAAIDELLAKHGAR